jgi:hypothetical protein
MADFDRARDFVYRQGRVLEQRLFATLFEEAPATGVVRALEAFRNDDGGLGHGLEPDKRDPASHPLDLQFGFEVLELAGAESDIPATAAGFLERVADDRGAIPFLLLSARGFPHAGHLALDVFYAPHPWPTSSMCAWLHRFGVRSEWLDRATEWVHGELERNPPTDAHAIKEALRFARYAPGAAELGPRIAAQLDHAEYFLADADDPEYGVTPLEIDGVDFPQEQLDAHARRLDSEQEDDGGWPLRWEPPSEDSRLDWRAHRTVTALHTLRRHGLA